MRPRSTDHIRNNIKRHTRRAGKYDDVHHEIFNEVEQRRLETFLAEATRHVQSDGREALDFGCGTGNLTAHLLQLGFDVTAADVTPAFLSLVSERFGVATHHLVDGEVDGLADDQFDVIGMYSVLHHVPDYERTLQSLGRKLKPGGVLVIEHEKLEAYYSPGQELSAFRKENFEATRTGSWDPDHKRWQYLIRAALSPRRHYHRYLRMRGIPIEGDIHVHAHDHIQWDLVRTALRDVDVHQVAWQEHLLFSDDVDRATWLKWRDRTADTAAFVGRRSR